MYQSDLKHPEPSLEDKLYKLYTLNRNKKIDLSFRPPFLQLLQAFGNPQDNLPPVIHVAGTNGKGSIIAMLRACLEAAGYKVHAYTSPHLVRFNERIVLAGQEIGDEALEALIDKALELNGEGELTFFEITTAMAFAAFAAEPADICLLEVGMGGRLDCTNIIEKPLLSIISSIGMDHQEWLGDTIEEIAAEKAGIMKSGVPCVIAPQPRKGALETIRAKAAEAGSPLYEVEANPSDHDIALMGAHQKANLAAVLKALELIQNRFPVDVNEIQKALKNVSWRARLQKLDPTEFGLSQNFELYLDGGHNPDAGEAIALQCQEWAKDDTPLFAVLGMMQGKDTAGFAAPILPHLEALYAVNIENEPQSQSAQNLQSILPSAQTAQNYADALKDITSTHDRGRILICGSLYLAGHVLKAMQK